MIRTILIFIIMSLTAISIMSCSQDTPVTQQSLASDSQDDALALYLLGNEAPIEAEQVDNFMFHGPGPFFLWVLDLTDEQKESLKEIGDKYREQMHSLHMQARQEGHSEDLRAMHEEIRQAMMEEIFEILTAGQKAVLDQIQTQIDAGQYPAIVIEKRVAHLTEILNLDEDQQTAIAELMSDYGAKILQLRADQTDPRQFHEAARTVMQEYREAIKAILNEEQLALFEELKAKFRGKGPHRSDRPGHGWKH